MGFIVTQMAERKMVIRPAIAERYKISGFQLQRWVDVMGVNMMRG